MAEVSILRADEYRRRKTMIAGWEVGVASYKLGYVYVCEVDNSDPGTRLSRGLGAIRIDAETQALRKAERMLVRTRVQWTL